MTYCGPFAFIHLDRTVNRRVNRYHTAFLFRSVFFVLVKIENLRQHPSYETVDTVFDLWVAVLRITQRLNLLQDLADITPR